MEAVFTADQFTPSERSTVEAKAGFANHFVKFVTGGFLRKDFPEWFYARLSSIFGHIAHHNRVGFYSIFFESTRAKTDFISMCLSNGGYGDPRYTYSDVEKALKKWIVSAGIERTLEEQRRQEECAADKQSLYSTLKTGMLENGVCGILDLMVQVCDEQVAQQVDFEEKEWWGMAGRTLQGASHAINKGSF